MLYFQNGDSLVSPVKMVFYEPAPPLPTVPPIPALLEVYPNPTAGNITIKTPSQCREIQIFDVLGRKLMDKAVQGYIQQIDHCLFYAGVFISLSCSQTVEINS